MTRTASMADIDVAVVLSLAQTIAIIAALLLTLYFSRKQLEGFRIDLETRVLSDVDEKFHRIGEIFIEKPELVHTIYKTPEALGPDLPFTYYALFFCAHIFHMRQRGIMGTNEWTGWLQWMKNAFRYGTLANTWREAEMESWFDPDFQRFVREQLLPASAPAG